MADAHSISSALVAEYNSVKPPHRTHAAVQRIIDLVDGDLTRAVGNLPMHAMLPGNARKLAEIEAYLLAARRLMDEVAADETPRQADPERLTAAERRYYRQRAAVVAKIKAFGASLQAA